MDFDFLDCQCSYPEDESDNMVTMYRTMWRHNLEDHSPYYFTIVKTSNLTLFYFLQYCGSICSLFIYLEPSFLCTHHICVSKSWSFLSYGSCHYKIVTSEMWWWFQAEDWGITYIGVVKSMKTSIVVSLLSDRKKQRDELYIANNASECKSNNGSEPVNIQQF